MAHTFLSAQEHRFGPGTPERPEPETVRNRRPAQTERRALLRYPDVTSLAWWCWAGLSVALVLTVCGFENSQTIALGIAVFQAVTGLLRHRSPAHYSNQVRIVFLILVAAGFLSPPETFKWGLAAGTTSMVLFGYCPIARMLALLPFNRNEILTPGLAWRIVFSARDSFATSYGNRTNEQ